MTEEEAKQGRAKKVQGVIDRVEDGDIAVILLGDDEEHSIDVPLSLLPAGASGGQRLTVTFVLDADAARKASERAQEMRERLERLGSANAGKKDFKL
jgi:acylphosphatase